MDKQSQNIHLLLIRDFEKYKLLGEWSKPRKFMPLKYVKKNQKDHSWLISANIKKEFVFYFYDFIESVMQ